jgi:hypothetical protein
VSVNRVHLVDVAPQPRIEGLFRSPLGRAQILAATPLTPPIVSGQSPPAGSAIPPSQLVEFTLSGLYGLFVVFVSYPSGATEVVWDGSVLTPKFNKGSNLTGTGSIRTCAIQRTGGWLESPTFEVVTPGGF